MYIALLEKARKTSMNILRAFSKKRLMNILRAFSKSAALYNGLLPNKRQVKHL